MGTHPVLEAPASSSAATKPRAVSAGDRTKRSFADKRATKLELGHEGESIHYPRRALHVSIADDGGISFDDHLIATAGDLGLGKLADALKDRRQAVDAEHLVLQVASEATCQRLIDLLNLAARIHLPVVIDDADSEEPQ